VILCDERRLSPQDFNLGKMKKAKTKPKSFDLGENEMHIIGEALKEYKGNYTEAAKALGITRATLYRKIEKYGI
jgi:transcriptional regulator of acetoin/glycerol metabolism